jgi:hypothetical protein
MSFKAPKDQDKTINDRDPSFENDISMKSKSENQNNDRDFDDFSYQTRSDFSKGATIPKDIGPANLDESALEASNGMIKSIHNVTANKPDSKDKPLLNPVPSTAGG